jgi:hypothetical protein
LIFEQLKSTAQAITTYSISGTEAYMFRRSILALASVLAIAVSNTSAQSKPTAAKSVANKPAGGQTYQILYKLKAGEVLASKVSHFAETLTKIGEHIESSSSRTASDKVWEVKSVDDKGNMTFEYRVTSVNLAQRIGDKAEFKYDSETDTTAPDIFKKVAESVNKPIATITINPRGQVVNRDKDTKTPQLGIGDLTVPLPAEPVAIGAEWSVPRELRIKLEDGSFKNVKIRELYTLEKVSAGVATIRLESQPLTPLNDANAESQLMQQLSNGYIKFDLDRGRLISKQLDWAEEAVGFRGDNTSLKYDAKFTEELQDEAAKTASTGKRSIVE